MYVQGREYEHVIKNMGGFCYNIYVMFCICICRITSAFAGRWARFLETNIYDRWNNIPHCAQTEKYGHLPVLYLISAVLNLVIQYLVYMRYIEEIISLYDI